MRASQGFFSITRTCSRCNGEGKIIEKPCKQCHGSGRIRSRKTISVKVPAGVETGSRLKMTGAGEEGYAGGQSGDLYIVIRVLEHEIFQRQEDDIVCQVPVSFPVLALGGTVDVPTIEGAVKLKIPAGTQTGKVFRLKHKGIANLHGYGRGDQLVQVIAETPAKLTDEQRTLLEKFAAIAGDSVHPISHSFFEKVKKFFI